MFLSIIANKKTEIPSIGRLRSYDGNCNENITLKLNFALSYVFCDYSMLITLYKIGGVHSCLLGTNGFHVKAKNERFTAASSRCRQNLKYENFTSSFGRLRQNIPPKSMPHVQHDYFSSFNQSNHWFVALQHSRKLSFYHSVKKNYSPFASLDSTRKKTLRRTLVKLRIGCHNLHVETGRYDKIPLDERICPLYSGNRELRQPRRRR